MHTKEKGKEELVGGKLVALQCEGRVVNLTPTTPLFPARPSHCCVTNFLCADSSFPFPFKHLPCRLLDNISTRKINWAIHGIVIIYSMDRAISNFQRIGVRKLKSLAVHIHVQYSDIMRFTLLHNRHHKVPQSVSIFMHCKTVPILLRIRVRGHFVMSITKIHESHYDAVLDNPRCSLLFLAVMKGQ